MPFSLIKKGQTPTELLTLMATNSQLSQQVANFFAPQCDCNVVDWVKAQITASNLVVINAIKAMIAKETVAPPPNIANTIKSTNGDTFVLIRTWCDGGSKMGEFISNDNTSQLAVITANDPSCLV